MSTTRSVLLSVAAVALVFACGGPTPPPSNCWVGFRGEYHLEGPHDAAIAEAGTIARIINSRLAATGLAVFQVRTEQGTVIVDLPDIADAHEFRALIVATGDILFVPVPEGSSVEIGDPLPPGLTPLFGRDAVASVRPSSGQAGQSAVDIDLAAGAAQVLADWSRRSIGRQLAVVLDGTVLLAPVVQSPLDDGSIQISGGSLLEANRLATMLSLPPFPGTLEGVSFSQVEPPAGCRAMPS